MLRRRVGALYAGLIGANALAWGWAVAAFHGHPALLGTALLAYGFGLRHAVDADHIAAIDNVTRKLMQDGQRPVAVGFFFALGHSSIVLVAATVIAASAATLQHRYPGLIDAGGTIGTAVSAAFLLAIAAVNAVLLVGTLPAVRDGKARRRLSRRRARKLSRAPRPAGADAAPAVPADLTQLAHVPARPLVRARFRYRERDRAVGDRRRPRR